MAQTNVSFAPPLAAAQEFIESALAATPLVVKNASGAIFSIYIDNSAAVSSVVYVKLYDSNGAVVVGTTDPDWIIRVPVSGIVTIPMVPSIAYASGLQVAAVTTPGTAGNTPPANVVVVRIVYS